MEPVARGWCRYESLLDGSIDLADVALMNDAIAVRLDNETEARRKLEQKNGR
ncbi:DUF6889 family protein [Paraburkholderia caballeronis]|uniref:DUF6889 family protein n=1 Tax=Paraburkholderia caballeronis TaxID=416943 RepID=UPI001FB865F9|nr:hypothetical protein [Paraburkholderia caballeronis]